MRGRIARVVSLAAVLALGACGGGDGQEADADLASATSTTAFGTTDTSGATDTTAAAADGETTTTAGVKAAQKTTATTAKAASSPTTAASSPTTTATAAPPETTTTAAPPPSGATAAITIVNFSFDPPFLTVAKGTRVTATNQDTAAHTWTAENGAWDSGNLSKGASYEHTFDTSGTFNYRCDIHTSMKGIVTVE